MLPFNEEQIKRISQQYPTPFLIYDEKGICDNMAKIKKAFAWNEGFREYFAVKACPNPAIIKILKKYGCGLDCASLVELIMAEKLGITSDGIMFTSNDTPACEFKKANELSAIINFDDPTHIDLCCQNGGTPKTVCFRYNPGTDFIVQNDIMGELKESKFGMTKQQLLTSVKKLKALGAEKFGVHAMLASCALNEDYYPTLAKEIFLLALEIKRETGVELSFVDLAGGIGIPYRPEEKAIDIIKIGENVRKVYDDIIAKNGMKLSIFTEMGRFVTGPYGYLVSQVLHEKHTYKNYLGLDATACNLMRPAIYGAYHHITILGKEDETPNTIYDVTGSLCENNDKFAVNRLLPKTKVGDIAVIHDAGAHGYSMGYNYNGKLKCAELLMKENGTAQLIRRAETPKDYFATLDIYDEFNKS